MTYRKVLEYEINRPSPIFDTFIDSGLIVLTGAPSETHQ